MSNKKLKTESYQQFGGINSKVSPYLNTPIEFLDLSNLDFQTPGSLTQRWGSTQYIGQTFAGRINTLVEFQKLDGSSYLIIGVSGGLWSGATTGNHLGLSQTHLGITTSFQFCHGNGLWTNLAASPTENNFGLRYLDNTSLSYNINGSGYQAQSGITIADCSRINGKNKISSVAFQDWLFMADGDKFIKYNGSSAYNVGLPFPSRIVDVSDVMIKSSSGTTVGFGFSLGYMAFYAQYVNNRGFVSQIWPIHNSGAWLAVAGNSAAASLGTFSFTFNTPLSYGISTINIFGYLSGTTLFSTGASPYWNLPYRQLQTIPASGSSITQYAIGSSVGGQTIIYNVNTIGKLPYNPNYPIPGFTLLLTDLGVTQININPYYPRHLSVYKDKLVASGFSSALSTFVWSDDGEPEGYPAENFQEIRTNDSDYITGHAPFKGSVVFFKKNSFHAATWDNANNMVIQELSTQYGCVNHFSIVNFNNSLAFLDRKGVMLWSGSGLEYLSAKVQPVFDRMNYNSALDEACMAHDKLRNQLVVSFPVDGATLNNMVMCYDYSTNAWTRHDGYAPSVLTPIQGRNVTKNLFYGSYSGVINWFGPSFLSDNGTGFTTYIKTRFLHNMGDSSTKMFRRLFMNIDAPGSTLTFNINFKQDYGTSTVLATTLVISQFQNRIDFGIAGKSLAFEASIMQTAVPLKVHGFTIESRLQRMV